MVDRVAKVAYLFFSLGVYGACHWSDGSLGFEEAQELQEGVWDRVPETKKSIGSVHYMRRLLGYERGTSCIQKCSSPYTDLSSFN
jgi:hypothetical protein